MFCFLFFVVVFFFWGGGLYYVFSSESLYGQAKAGIEPRTSTIIRLKDEERLKLAPFFNSIPATL